MLCRRCDGPAGESAWVAQRPQRQATCDQCGATLLTVQGVSLGGGGEMLEFLARFGLASTGKPLLTTKREEA
jgi:ribosomal protein S27E